MDCVVSPQAMTLRELAGEKRQCAVDAYHADLGI